MKYLVATVWLVLAFGLMGYSVIEIDKWERAHNFPFGKMCQLTNSCR